MRDLKIEIVTRDALGSIVALITPHGVIDADTASAEIASGRACYLAGPNSYVRAPIKAITTDGGTYLYANWDGTRRNNLHDLAPIARRTVSRNTITTPATPTQQKQPRPPRPSFWSTVFQAFGLR